LLAPFAFLQRPARWLQAISRYHGTISGGPNFAYDICVTKIKPEIIETLDLSHWRLAYSGAEPVRMETIRKFSQTFAPCGFRMESFYPCYGLAEATLFVTGGYGPGIPESMPLQRAAFEQRRVTPAAPDDTNPLTLINCGSPKGDVQLAIVDPDTLTAYGDDEIGEIWISGSNVAQGYWDRPEETARTFQARLADNGEGPYFRSGDLGFLHKGDLYVAGRLKDLIIIRGSNHYPQDIELTVDQCHEALYPGSGAAFSIEVNDDEQLVICQEVSREFRNAKLDEVIRAIRRAVAENHDLQVYAVALLRPLTIPKTSSGKIQRHVCKAAFLNGSLDIVQEWRQSSG
jgi:acyl-CoA synthetase (AMP-forming)/AMP-acid ligase II